MNDGVDGQPNKIELINLVLDIQCFKLQSKDLEVLVSPCELGGSDHVLLEQINGIDKIDNKSGPNIHKAINIYHLVSVLII